MTTTESNFFPDWNQLTHNDNDSEWELRMHADWPQRGSIQVRFYINSPNSEVSQKNYEEIVNNWGIIWPRILSRTETLILSYDHNVDDIDIDEDYFYIRVPEEPLIEGASWSIMLQSMIGWLLDFEGWEDSGEQGVF